MTQYIKHANAISIAPDFSGIAIDKVPAGYYRINVSQALGFHLVPVEPLEVPAKIYGSLLKHAPRIKEVYAERLGVPTTVMLEGLKGSGKSLMMKSLARDFVEQEEGIVLLCNAAFVGDDFFEFLQSITQDKYVLMDEFDKVYKEKDDRNNILTLLDGTYAQHTLFILTMNAASDSSAFEFFHNRPGRVFFNIKFNAVDPEAIEAYLQDNLNDKGRISEVLQFVNRFVAFNMDMLGTFTREINACPTLTLDEISIYLNIKPDVSLDDVWFESQVTYDGLNITDAICKSYINSNQIRDFLSYMQRGNAQHAILNIEVSGCNYWNATKNVPWSDKSTDAENDDRSYGVNIRKGRKEVFIEYFDWHITGTEVKTETCKLTGMITLSQVFQDDEGADHNIVMTIQPQMIKRARFM